MRLAFSSVFVLLSLATLSAGGDTAPSAGLKPGTSLPKDTFHPFNVTGKHQDHFHCLVCEHGLHPVVVVFARVTDKVDEPVLELLKRLEVALDRHDRASLAAYAVFLHEDILDDERRSAAETKREDLEKDDDQRVLLIKKLQEEVKTPAELNRLVLGLYSAAGPKGYNIDKDADVTVLLYDKHQVKAGFAFSRSKPMAKEDVDAILAAVVQKLVLKK